MAYHLQCFWRITLPNLHPFPAIRQIIWFFLPRKQKVTVFLLIFTVFNEVRFFPFECVSAAQTQVHPVDFAVQACLVPLPRKNTLTKLRAAFITGLPSSWPQRFGQGCFQYERRWRLSRSGYLAINSPGGKFQPFRAENRTNPDCIHWQ